MKSRWIARLHRCSLNCGLCDHHAQCGTAWLGARRHQPRQQDRPETGQANLRSNVAAISPLRLIALPATPLLAESHLLAV
jgi:hypothetical protein